MARMSSPEPSSPLSPDVAQRLKRDDAGLVAAIIQDDTNGDVLMLGWMDDEALRRTLSEGRVTFWSRSRGEYWRKGDTSGHAQYVRSVALDCDGDALLVRVDQVGAACHTGERSCFFTDLDAAVASAVDATAMEAAAKEITVESRGEGGLEVFGSQELIGAAVSNLVANAVAYSDEGSRVVVTTRSEGDEVQVTVVDQGIGIPASDIDRIFERFYRVDPARHRSTGGTGLGLSIVKHVAATHGGDISVWSVQGQGSTFTLTLPRRSDPQHGASTTPVDVVVPVDLDATSLTPARRQQETRS